MRDRSTRAMRRPVIGRRIRPLQQGDLDGLCGVYAIINAIRHLCPEVDTEHSRELFIAMMQARHELALRRPLVFVYDGLGRRPLTALANAAIEHLAHTAGIDIEVEWLAPAKGGRSSLPTLWRKLSAHIGSTGIAIVGLAGRTSHWTVVIDITCKQMRLLDSDGLSVLRRSRCSPRPGAHHHSIEPGNILLVKRLGRSDSASAIELLV